MKILRLVLVSLMFGSVGCGKPPGTEVHRLTSPDNMVDAVLVDYSGGALSSYSCGVYIVPKGGKWSETESVMYINKVAGFWIAWRSAGFLEMHYRHGEVYKFQSMWDSAKINNFHYRVELRLFPESEWTIETLDNVARPRISVNGAMGAQKRFLFPMYSEAKVEPLKNTDK